MRVIKLIYYAHFGISVDISLMTKIDKNEKVMPL